MSLKTQYYGLRGGLDLVTPPIEMKQGRAIAGLNYEPVAEGYARIKGFERLDGQPSPSEVTYWVLNFDGGTAAITEGQTVTGATSSATGKALIDAVVESGSYGGGDAAGYLVLTNLTGTFQDNENLQVSAVTKSQANGTATEEGADNDTDHNTWYQDAVETARALIQKPPGSGPVRGVHVYNGDKYSFRDNVGGTAGVMYKATTSGWSAVSLGRELAFTSGGTTEIVVGNTITGAISGATAVITRVILTSGTWAGGDAAGRFYFASQTGTFQAENLNVGATLNLATIAGNSTAITLPAGGHYDCKNHNFYGASNLMRMYGCQGEGKGFEFDGTVFVQIYTTMTDDRPVRLEIHKEQLFFQFRGGSNQHSAPNDPHEWSPVVGAGEIAIGEEGTGLVTSSTALAMMGRNKMCVLFGDDETNWDLKTISEDSGAVAWTAQVIGSPIYLDNKGLRSLETTDRFGDFEIGTLTQLVEPLFDAKRDAGVSAVGALRVRSKAQYRLYWNDGSGITVYLGRGLDQPEILPFDLGVTLSCMASGKDSSGEEILLAGDEDGWVYQLDAGNSFDGAAVEAYLRLPFNHVGTPQQDKAWAKTVVEIKGGQNTELGIIAEFGYGDDENPSGQEISVDVAGGGGFWDELEWDRFFWSAPVNGQAKADTEGYGQNISIVIASDATYEDPHILTGVILYFKYRRLAR